MSTPGKSEINLIVNYFASAIDIITQVSRDLASVFRGQRLQQIFAKGGTLRQNFVSGSGDRKKSQ